MRKIHVLNKQSSNSNGETQFPKVSMETGNERKMERKGKRVACCKCQEVSFGDKIVYARRIGDSIAIYVATYDIITNLLKKLEHRSCQRVA